MDKSLFFQAVGKFFLGAVLVGLLLFLPAESFAYWNGWLFLAILLIPMFFAGLVMVWKSPQLLKKRLNVKERQAQQGQVIRLSGLMFLLGFLTAGLSFRWQWLMLPEAASWTGSAVFLLAYGLYAEVLRENAYLSRTIEVQENQVVIDTGLYGLVRHPMYAVTLLLFFSIPFVLGSAASVVIFLCYPALIVQRIRNEEAVLEAGLPGYMEYKKKVRYRLIPFVW